MVKFLKSDDTFSQDLTAGALSHSLTFTKPTKLQKITFHASVPITEIITITLDSAKGPTYDTILRRVTLVGKQDYTYTPEGENDYQVGDIIKVECTQANTTGTISGIIKTRELN